mmetsp:Transcript_165459/g.530906  ORF Transcript_165459/g.530906 Transcript_165459/m.530906 type:complete len:309 (+) Transcript_165459:702-1628(+)
MVRFRELAHLQAMYVVLAGRYFYAPWGSADDCHPVACAMMEATELQLRLMQGWRVQDEELLFCLHRCSPRSKSGPDEILLTTACLKVVVGREAPSDIVMPAQHMSKSHAVLTASVGGRGRPRNSASRLRLHLTDTSSNGVWLNGAQVAKEKGPVRLSNGDRVCFLPPSLGEQAAELEYEVVAYAPGGEQAQPVDSADAEGFVGGGGPGSGEGAPEVVVEDFEQPAARQRSRSRERQSKDQRELKEWLQMTDNGCLVSYESKLLERFDSTEQIRSLYAGDISAFFSDLGIANADHKVSFRRALLRLRKG